MLDHWYENLLMARAHLEELERAAELERWPGRVEAAPPVEETAVRLQQTTEKAAGIPRPDHRPTIRE